MLRRIAATALIGAAAFATLSAQAKPAASKTITHEITITADKVYTGTMDLTVEAGKVTGKMRLTMPTEITGVVGGTATDGTLALDFPYHMTENACDGKVKMSIKLPASPGPSTGTMEAVGCGIEDKLTGTVDIKPVPQKSPAR